MQTLANVTPDNESVIVINGDNKKISLHDNDCSVDNSVDDHMLDDQIICRCKP